MQSKTSYFKKELWKQAFRSSGWIGIGYFLALLFVLPLNVIMVKTRNEPRDLSYYQDYVDSLFKINGEVQSMLIIAIPILAAIFACRYMQVKGSADFIHSLPLKRSQLFYHQFLIGYLMVIIPVILTGFILYVMYGVIDVDFIYQHRDIWDWFSYTVTFVTFIYSIAFLVGTFTGISAVQGALSILILIFPVGISLLVMENLRMLVIGFSGDYSIRMSYFTKASPIFWIFELSTQKNIEIVSWYYWLLSIIFVGLSLVFYRIRHIESANQAIAFPLMKPIFKFGVTFCFMLLGGVYFGLTQEHYVGWIMFGYVCGALFGYVLAEMLLQKTWRVFDQWKGFVIYIGISMLVIVSVVFDWYGFETKVPSEDEVESVFFDSEHFLYNTHYDAEGNKIKQNITDPELINHVIDLHDFIVANDPIGRNGYQRYTENSTNVDIVYQLSNGKRMVRQYFIPSIEETEQYLQPIMDSEEYKRSTLAWLFDENSNISSVAIDGYDYRQQVNDQQTINKLTDAWKQDYLDASYAEMTQNIYGETKSLEVELDSSENFYHLPLLDSYTNVLEVLKEEELDRGLTINREDVSMVAITNSEMNEGMLHELPHIEDNELNEWMLVEKNEQIDELIKLNNGTKGAWGIALYGPFDNFIDAYQVREDQLPSYVTDYFE
ncbi:ABC-2 type transport system permease protein [Gracilibacillus orientalis]|uniref:ABC-2 type transport system permease protein n=1 Tax=Gracilibacillus orientalis TaxID=334253 RepID=A0A1I4MFN2_9BACI|nr:DUF6449 domain-containing protein [Gracilibacillus orientalis]SFM02084.1 ABC-2 type transport system permease protein [Gracilibacillus orientalis]